MVKLRNPLLSLDARGTISSAITFVRRRGQHIAERKPIPKDAETSEQLSWRTMFQLCRDLWHTLSPAEKQNWNSAAGPHHLTGYQWYMSQCLRPNPGVYLPLVGGTMQGAIDMATQKIEDLPDPAAAQEPVTRQYFEDNLPAGGYTEGVRVYHDAAQSINHDATTTLSFNSERYDTDGIHDLITNNERLTCRTAGKYLIVFNFRFATNANGIRWAYITHNTAGALAAIELEPTGAFQFFAIVTTIYPLAVNEYVTVQVGQDSGVALNIEVSSKYSPEFMMQRIG